MAKAAADFWPVGLILALFQAAGCDVRTAEPMVRMQDGDCMSVRYLLAPDGEAFVPLVDLADDDQVSEVEVLFWERRLGVNPGRPH